MSNPVATERTPLLKQSSAAQGVPAIERTQCRSEDKASDVEASDVITASIKEPSNVRLALIMGSVWVGLSLLCPFLVKFLIM